MIEQKQKKEVKKLEDMLPFNPFKVLGLRPKPLEEKYKRYAGLNRRMMASTIDTLFAAFLIAPFVDMLTEGVVPTREISFDDMNAANADPANANLNMLRLIVESGKATEFLYGSMMNMLALLVVSAICWKFWSATPGKILLRMKIVDMQTEQPLTNSQIIIRALGYIPSCVMLFMGIFWISLNKRRQGWHDMMAGSAVIIIPKKKLDIAKEKQELSV